MEFQCENMTTSSTSSAQQRGRIRWRAACVIAVLGIALAVGARRLVPDDAAARMLSTAAALALTGGCLALWLVFFSGCSTRFRVAAAAAMLATLLLLVAAFRISDVSGGFVPHLVWRAHVRPDGAVPAPMHPLARWIAQSAQSVFLAMAPLALGAWLVAFLARGRVLRWLPAAMLLGVAAVGNLAAARAWQRPARPLAATRLPAADGAASHVSGKSTQHKPTQRRRKEGPQGGVPDAAHPADAQAAHGQGEAMSSSQAHAGTAVAGAAEEAPAVGVGADDFPQFLGPDRNATLRGRRLARQWAAPPRLLWRQPIGPGWSGFAVVGNDAVTQQQLDELELVVCYDLKSGKLLWSHGSRVRYSSRIAGDGPRATPTIADGRVFALGSTGILHAIALADGRPLWEANILADHMADPLPWGQSGSPLVVGGLVIVNPGGPRGHSLAAYDAATGRLRWHAGDDAASYASPMLALLGGREQIVMVNQFSVTGHDPESGKVLWSYPPSEQPDHTWLSRDPKVPQPVVVSGDRLLISAGYGLGCMLLEVAPGGGNDWRVQELWPGFNRGLKPKFTNLVLHDGYLYGLDDGTALACLDLASGQRRWKQGRYGHGQLLLVDDLLVILSDAGKVALVEATPRGYRELASFQALEGKTWNTPTLAGRLLLVRNDHEAACYELPAE
ncbi:MAG: PQQ-like beta-propeller repeat protein [Pirellulales bacterium]|nr:PQQ-like beta-propeller repeat protein [Pirellulales bacterium]